MMEILQTNSPEVGNILNLVGIGLLLLAGFFYVQYKQTENESERETARKNFTAVALLFVFYAIVAYMYWDNADSWVVQIGGSLDAYFEQVAQNIVITEETAEVPENQTLLDQLLNGVRTIGLVAYVLLFGATAMVGKAPVKLYEAIFGN